MMIQSFVQSVHASILPVLLTAVKPLRQSFAGLARTGVALGLVLGAVALAPSAHADSYVAGTVFGHGAGSGAGLQFGARHGGGQIYVVPQGPSVMYGAPIWSDGRGAYVVQPEHRHRRHVHGGQRYDHGERDAYRDGYIDGRRDARRHARQEDRRELRRGW